MIDALFSNWAAFIAWCGDLNPIPELRPGGTVPGHERGGKPKPAAPLEKTMPVTALNKRDDTGSGSGKQDGSAAGVQFSGTIEMTPSQWADVQPNRRQRDTERHAKRAKHLRNPHPVHQRVNAARLPDGRLIKLDGHTRALLWERGELQSPQTVLVDVWTCENEGAAAALYSTFDNRGAVETSSDQMFGAVRELHLEFSSDLLKSGLYVHAIRFGFAMLYSKPKSDEMTVYDLVGYWRPELELLDGCEPGRIRFVGGVTVAALITLRRYGAEATDFWKSYAKGAGVKLENELDPVEMLEQVVRDRRVKKRLVGEGNVTETARLAITTFDRWWEGDVFKGHQRRVAPDKSITVSPVLQQVRAKTLSRYLEAARKVRSPGLPVRG